MQIKKFRRASGLFVVEGAKNLLELLSSDFKVQTLYLTPEFHKGLETLMPDNLPVVHVSEDSIKPAGNLESNAAGMAIVAMKDNTPLFPEKAEYLLVLDEVKDPGNLGTIIRIADWYGVKKVVCSRDTADLYNPKVIQASMGSFTRVRLYYCDLLEYFTQLDRTTYPVWAATLKGRNLYKEPFKEQGVVLLGNESRGISPELLSFVNSEITIPKFGGAESLNVGVATAVILDNVRRKFLELT